MRKRCLDISGLNYKSGFTLLELLLVIALMVIIAAMSRDFYGSFVSGAQLDANVRTIVYDLRNTRDKAMNGLSDQNWGVHFVNGASDYYEIFSSASDYSDLNKTIVVTTYLRNGNIFSSPAEGATTDVLFGKISGTSTAATIIVNAGQATKTITIKPEGLVN
jgi:prepilin-type N-terminal cleavage/methylation domain-containing protein